MAETLFSSSGPGAVKKWSPKAMYEIAKQSYFVSRMTGPESSRLPVCLKNDLEQGPGDELTMYLAAKLVGRPVQGKEKAEGRQQAINDYTDKIKIDVNRMPVDVGDLMDQKRRPYDLRQSVIYRIGEYWAEYMDEEFFVQLSGQRGTGSNIQHLPVGYTGFPITFTAPDSDHIVYAGAATGKASLQQSETMTRELVERVALRAGNFIGGTSKRFRMQMCQVEGAKYWVMILHDACMHDLRKETGEAGWLALEKARATAIGSKSPLFMGAAGATAVLNQVILHQHTSITYTKDYGAGANVPGFRNLFLGAHAGLLAYGTRAKTKNGVRMELNPSKTDLGFREVIDSICVMGIKRAEFDSKTFAAIAVDSSASATAVSQLLDPVLA